MATHDYVIANGTGAAVRSDLNGALAAIVSNNSSATAPATTYAYQWWADTTTGLLKIRNSANSAWVTIGTLASTNLGLLSLAGDTMTGVLAVTAGTAALPGIAVSGDTNTGIYSPGADQLAISTGGSPRITVDSSGRLLVGTSSARANFQNSSITCKAQIEGTDTQSTGLAIISNDSSSLQRPILYLYRNNGSTIGSNTVAVNGDICGQVIFGANDGSEFVNAATITTEVDGTPGSNDMPGRLVFSTTADGAASPTEAMRINNQRELLIGTTTRTANGGVLQVSNGITFPATQVACTDPNTLDDYEEGTWTPTVIGTSTAGTVTYGTRVARYTKVGRLVFIELRLSWSAGTGTGDLRFSGLPFTAAGETLAGLSVAFASILTLTANHVVTSRVFDATTEIQILSYPAGGGTSVNVAYDAEAQIGLAGCYTV